MSNQNPIVTSLSTGQNCEGRAGHISLSISSFPFRVSDRSKAAFLIAAAPPMSCLHFTARRVGLFQRVTLKTISCNGKENKLSLWVYISMFPLLFFLFPCVNSEHPTNNQNTYLDGKFTYTVLIRYYDYLTRI